MGYFCYLRKKCLNLDFISLEYYHWYNMWLYEDLHLLERGHTHHEIILNIEFP